MRAEGGAQRLMMMVMVVPGDDQGQAMPAGAVVARRVGILVNRCTRIAPIVTWAAGVAGAVVMMSLPVAIRVMRGMEAVMTVMSVMSAVSTPRRSGRCQPQTERGGHRSHNEFRCRFHSNQ